jgi:hypothetical protein
MGELSTSLVTLISSERFWHHTRLFDGILVRLQTRFDRNLKWKTTTTFLYSKYVEFGTLPNLTQNTLNSDHCTIYSVFKKGWSQGSML